MVSQGALEDRHPLRGCPVLLTAGSEPRDILMVKHTGLK